MRKVNYTSVQIPFKWSSVHRPIEYLYDMPTEEGNAIDFGGFLSWGIANSFQNGNIVAKVGDLLYASSGIYKGYHVVRQVITQTLLVTETAFISGSSGVFIKYATPPVWSVYAGYLDAEVIGVNPFPFTKVADFSPEGNSNGLLSFDISGYVKSVFQNKIVAPGEGTFLGSGVYYDIDYSMWTPYRIMLGGYFENILLALNSSIDTEILTREYVDTGKFLNTLQIVNTCGTTFGSGIHSKDIITFRLEGATQIPKSKFNNGFSNGFFKV